MKPGYLYPLLLAAACHQAPPPVVDLPAPAQTGSAPAPTAPRPVPATIEAAGSAPCDKPELWLAVVKRDNLEAHYCDTCQEHCEPDGDGERKMPWGMIDTPSDDYLMGRYGCNELKYAWYAIGAFSGERITDKPWAAYFAKQPWYRPAGDVTLSAAAQLNRAWLRGLLDKCEKHADQQISAAERLIVAQWFAQKDEGTPPLPATLMMDGAPATREAFMQFVGNKELFRYTPRTPLSVVDIKGTTRVLSAGTGAPGMTCMGLGEGCEGFEWLELSIDQGGNIVALHAAAAACPFVYVDGTYQGEILRNLNQPQRASTQALQLRQEACSETLTVRIAEEKDETTYLDWVGVEVDGEIMAPRICASSSHAVCTRDGEHHVLSRGDVLELSFDTGCRPAELVAHGHYERSLLSPMLD